MGKRAAALSSDAHMQGGVIRQDYCGKGGHILGFVFLYIRVHICKEWTESSHNSISQTSAGLSNGLKQSYDSKLDWQ